MSHKIRKSLPENPQMGRKEKNQAAGRRQKESDRRRGVREEQIILFWSRGIVTAVRRVAARLRFFGQISAKISPIVEGGNYGRSGEKGAGGGRIDREGGCKGAAGKQQLRNINTTRPSLRESMTAASIASERRGLPSRAPFIQSIPAITAPKENETIKTRK